MVLMVNKCCIPAYRSNYKSRMKGVHLIIVTLLLNNYSFSVCHDVARYKTDMPILLIAFKIYHIISSGYISTGLWFPVVLPLLNQTH